MELLNVLLKACEHPFVSHLPGNALGREVAVVKCIGIEVNECRYIIVGQNVKVILSGNARGHDLVHLVEIAPQSNLGIEFPETYVREVKLLPDIEIGDIVVTLAKSEAVAVKPFDGRTHIECRTGRGTYIVSQ